MSTCEWGCRWPETGFFSRENLRQGCPAASRPLGKKTRRWQCCHNTCTSAVIEASRPAPAASLTTALRRCKNPTHTCHAKRRFSCLIHASRPSRPPPPPDHLLHTHAHAQPCRHWFSSLRFGRKCCGDDECLGRGLHPHTDSRRWNSATHCEHRVVVRTPGPESACTRKL